MAHAHHDHGPAGAHKHSHSHEHEHEHEHAPAAASACCAGSSCGAATQALQPPVPPLPGAQRYRIATMDCAAEESEIRRALEPLSGIGNLRFDLGQRVLSVQAPQAVQADAVQALRRIGFEPQPLADAQAAPPVASGLPRLVAALVLATGAEGLHYFMPEPAWLAMAVAAAAIGLAGFDTFKKGWAALRALRLNINALMTVAVTGAFIIGQWPEAAMVMALYAIAELIEGRAVDRARHAIRDLLALAPESAEVRQSDGGWRVQPVADVAVDAVVRLKPGERVPLDGVVTEGRSTVDQAPVTGESLPVEKGRGDPLYAGTINQGGALEFRVTATAGNSTLARIIEAVEQAQGARAPTQRLVDRFAAVYTPAVFALALGVALLTPLLLGWTWLAAAYKALVLLVIACPCALVISTPVTVVSGLAAAARRGILIKGGVYLEQARRLKAVALDKTGTVTEGRPVLVATERIGSADEVPAEALARSLAARSDHPVSQAIAAGLEAPLREVQDFQAVAGRGVQGRIDGRDYVLANKRWIAERGLGSAALDAQLLAHEQAGRSLSLLADAERVLAVFAVADTIKPGSRAAVAELQALGLTTVMLSGDNPATARAIAAQAGIGEVHGQLLPEDKQVLIAELQTRLGPTAMVGDGINDAPALARADIGFAMGAAGTHTAMEAADVVVMNDDLQRLPETIRLSRRTHAVLWQNIVLALGIKAGFLVAALVGEASMWMAVFADMGASLLVVFNGLRLLRGAGGR